MRNYSAHLVDPELLAWLAAMPADALSRDTLESRRAITTQVALDKMRPLPPQVSLEEYFVRTSGGAPDVRVLVYRHEPVHDAPAILHLHGGGFVFGLPEMSRVTAAGYSAALGATVVSVDYRLAPETPYPGSLDDCYAVLGWMHENARSLGIDRSRIAVSGESAGGGLAAALTLLARDRGRYAIAFQHLVFPMLDDRTATRCDLSPFVGEYVWTQACTHFGWSAFLGTTPGGETLSAYAAPARAMNLMGLPPASVMCGSLDLFIDENMEYARRLLHAGIPCELRIYTGAPHGFPMAWRATVSQRFERDSLEALRRGLGVPR